MDTKPIVIKIDHQKLILWIKQGILFIAQEDIVAIPFDYEQACTCLTADNLLYFAELPAKYENIFASNKLTSIPVLIDEVEKISLCSMELTQEKKAVYANMNEGWLPFVFQVDWFVSATSFEEKSDKTIPDESQPQLDTPSEPIPSEETVSAKKTTRKKSSPKATKKNPKQLSLLDTNK